MSKSLKLFKVDLAHVNEVSVEREVSEAWEGTRSCEITLLENEKNPIRKTEGLTWKTGSPRNERQRAAACLFRTSPGWRAGQAVEIESLNKKHFCTISDMAYISSKIRNPSIRMFLLPKLNSILFHFWNFKWKWI